MRKLEMPPAAPDHNRSMEATISVVIPARDAAATIAALLRCLVPDRALLQEILLVDDRSTDTTAALAAEIAQRHGLPLKILPAACGNAGAARNLGLTQAQGRYLFFIDADDELVPGALAVLTALLRDHPAAGLALGACLRQTANRPDKLRLPLGYTEDRAQNALRYLANDLLPIAMGSALLVTAPAADLRFPETIALDEDTFFWTALLSRVPVVTTTQPVLRYKLDEARMAHRHTAAPRPTVLHHARAFRRLAAHGVPKSARQQRTAWIARRIARQLIMARRYTDAAGLLRLVRQHPRYHRSWIGFRYAWRIHLGRWLQSLGLRPPPARPRHPMDPQAPRRTLVLTVDFASPPVSGADLRNHQNALAAAPLGPVTVVSIRPPVQPLSGPATAGHPPGIKFITIGVPGEKSPALSSWRSSVEARIPRACLPRLLTLIREFRPDTLIVEGVPLTALLPHLRPLTSRLILDLHNVESHLAAQRPARRFWPRRLATSLKIDARKMRRLEQRALKLADQIWVCSPEDRERLLELHRPVTPVHVVPNTIPRFEPLPFAPRPQCDPTKNGSVLLFVGLLGYWPNVLAAQRLARHILPLVRATFPAARVILTGRHPAPAVQTLATLPGVELHANPSRLAEFYQRTDLAVIPLTAGGGTRLKILEAMAAGLPVIATAIAVEGLGLTDREEFRLADTDADFAREIVALLRDPAARQQQIQYAEKTVRLRFTPSAAALAIRQSLTQD